MSRHKRFNSGEQRIYLASASSSIRAAVIITSISVLIVAIATSARPEEEREERKNWKSFISVFGHTRTSFKDTILFYSRRTRRVHGTK